MADVAPVVRTVAVADVLPATATEREQASDGPSATGKWLTASVVEDNIAPHKERQTGHHGQCRCQARSQISRTATQFHPARRP